MSGANDQPGRASDVELDDLVREVDRLCVTGDWPGLIGLRDRCRRAYEETGRQLWPAATLAEYRLALEAPGEFAAVVLVEGTGHLGLGPLAEVAASSHTWADLAPHVTPGPVAWLAAHERVVRGEDLRDGNIGPVLEVPLSLAPWEPEYLVPVYKPSEVELPSPPSAALSIEARPPPGKQVDDPDALLALRALAERWVVESAGTVEAVAVRGAAEEAVAAITDGPSVRWRDISLAEGLQLMAWAAASGGAHGRRRGSAVGRFEALWAVAAVCGLTGDWPVDHDELGENAAELRWCQWHPDEPPRGWSLHLAVEDAAEGLAWAVAAVDRG